MESANNKYAEQLQQESVLFMSRQQGIPEEEIIFGLMRSTPEVVGAMQDWDDIQNICIAVIRELKPYVSFRQIYDLVNRVVRLYDTQIITVLRVYSDVKRLAYFINEMIEVMLETPAYCAHVEQTVRSFTGEKDDRVAARGVVLRRITSPEVRKLFISPMCGKTYISRMRVVLSSPFSSLSQNPNPERSRIQS